MPTCRTVQRALLTPYNPRKILDAVPLVALEFHLASQEETRRVRNEYKILRDDFIAAAREEALALWGDFAPKDVLMKTIDAGRYYVHHKHLVSLGGGNDTLLYLPNDVHTELHRRHNMAGHKVMELVGHHVRGTREHPLTLEKKFDVLAKKLSAIDGVALRDNRIFVDIHMPTGKILIPQLLPFSPVRRLDSVPLRLAA